ncbi:MAG: hypothetical protein AABZ47_01585, partial [Planctomycetota bacterium]
MGRVIDPPATHGLSSRFITLSCPRMAIRVQNVTKQFGPKVVLENLTIELPDREVVGLVGPNGAGKT